MAEATATETSNYEVQDIPQVALAPTSLLSNCDILAFLAIIQNARVPLLDFEPILSKERDRKGHGTFVVRFSDEKGLVFKTASVDQDTTVEDARRRLLSEILILQHPALRNHPNFLLLRGVAWEVHPDISSFGLAMPVLVFEECQIGTLKELMIATSDCRERVPFLERLSLCNQIGSAVEAMHRFSE
jgi:serine/threonine protein kinase